MPRRENRFWASTRGQLLSRLRQGTDTVSDLATALGLTDSAVRFHLTALEGDGLVRRSGTRRGPRKPTVTYALTDEAERLFPKEYGPILRNLLEELKDRLPADQIDAVVRAAGHRFARAFRPLDRSARPEARVEKAEAVLRDLGGCCERQEQDGSVVLGCSVCPLAVASEGHPEVCRLVETVLTDVVAAPVRQQCQVSPPRCRFEITSRPAGRSGRAGTT